MADKCRKCGRPIIFLSKRPTAEDPRPRPVPIDPLPSAGGSVAIYSYPSPNSVYPKHRDAAVRFRYIAFLYNEAAKFYRRAGGILYTSHFDTCKGS